MKKVTKAYSNISIPSGSVQYKRIDSYSELGVDANEYDLFSYIVKGWNGTSPYEIAKGSSGTDIYLIMPSGGLISSMSIDYYFIEK